MRLIRCACCGKSKVTVLNEDDEEEYTCAECEANYQRAKAEVQELDKRFGVGK